MLEFSSRDGPKPKCFFTSSTLSAYIDHSQLPSKKQPFSTIASQPFVHTLDITISKDHVEALKRNLASDGATHKYAKVYMKLEHIVDGDFFNHYVKSGNVLMLSEGRPGIDHNFSLVEGVLRLEVDKPTFERMGLEGEAIPNGGRKHVKARYAIELNLRLPSMVHGKKGFERIVWAFKNVLNSSVTWLFYDLKGPTDGSGPIATHHPIIKTTQPEIEELHEVTVPEFPDDIEQEKHQTAAALLEWLSLVAMGSPRVQHEDDMDSYLSRYNALSLSSSNNGNLQVQDLVCFRWRGFLPSKFIQEVYLATLKASGDSWFSLNTAAFEGKAYTILQDKQHTMTWEYMD